MARSDVLVVGAGPTGLVLAYWLARLGVRARIVDKVAEPGTTSRALGVQARTLELYRQIGLADELVAGGLRFGAANLWVSGRPVARVPFGEMGKGLSPYPYMLIFPQDQHERLLIGKLAEVGLEVERPLELVAYEEQTGGVVAQLQHPDGRAETCEATYLAGCDGARSIVRDVVKPGFPGGTYAHLFYVADAVGDGPTMNHELHVALDDAGFLGVFPMPGERRARLIGTIKQSSADAGRPLGWNDVSPIILKRLGIAIERVNWFSTYHVHHRVAARFRAGRVFLAGDAAHIHSPVGAQGMNTGLGDAINLAWKLAAVVQQRAPERLLDTYEPERIAFAKKLIATTDRVFQLVSSEGKRARWIRTRVVPFLMPKIFSFTSMQRFMYRTVSQTSVEYRASALSSGRAGEVCAGDRLPWIALDSDIPDNFVPLKSLDWQVHVYGKPSAAVESLCKARQVALHEFVWRDAMGAVGFKRDAAYLVRPDGYVGCADRDAEAQTLERYLATWVMVPRPVT